jgi:prepilin-type processing-associated H-X9-DG protein
MGGWAYSFMAPEGRAGIAQYVEVGWGQKCFSTADLIDGTANTAAFAEWRKGSGSYNLEAGKPNGGVWTIASGGGSEWGAFGGSPAVTAAWDTIERNCNGEIPGAGPGSFGPTGYWPHQGYIWCWGGGGHTFYTHDHRPNRNSCIANGWWDASILANPSSYHPGSTNILMADGTVKSVSEGIDEKLWRATGTINGQEQVANLGTAGF